MNRRAFLKTSTTATALLLAAPAWCAPKAASQPGDDSILAQAKDGIEKHRKGDGAILVRNAQGQPVPDAKVSLEQLRHDFLFGCNFFLFDRCGQPELETAYRERFAAIFNYCTLGFYWAHYEPERGQPNYAYTDKAAEWTRTHGIACKGHPLVWDHPASSPNWLPDDHAEIKRLSDARVREIVSRFKGRIDIWDVVNEATHLPVHANKTKMAEWGATLGPVQYVQEPLRLARAANPQATLLVNDYRTDKPYYQILERQRENGKFLFDVIGIQSHMHDGAWPLHKLQDLCDTYGQLGLPIHFTETTILSGSRKGKGENWEPTSPEGEARQAEKTVNFYTTLFAHPAMQAITWWDFADLGAWQRAPAGWLRQDMSPKPVYDRLLALIKGQWWTKTQGRTDAQGKFTTRAFFGTYRITVEQPNGQKTVQEATWQRATPNQVEVTL